MKHKRKKPASRLGKLADEKAIRKMIRDEIRLASLVNLKAYQKQFQNEFLACLAGLSSIQ